MLLALVSLLHMTGVCKCAYIFKERSYKVSYKAANKVQSIKWECMYGAI